MMPPSESPWNEGLCSQQKGHIHQTPYDPRLGEKLDTALFNFWNTWCNNFFYGSFFFYIYFLYFYKIKIAFCWNTIKVEFFILFWEKFSSSTSRVYEYLLLQRHVESLFRLVGLSFHHLIYFLFGFRSSKNLVFSEVGENDLNFGVYDV